MKKLKELIDQAEREGKWLFCSYQQLWFSPSELRAANQEGRFRWGAMNFRLRDPSEKLTQLSNSIRSAQTDRESFIRRLSHGEASNNGEDLHPKNVRP